MSLVSALTSGFQRVATEFNTVRSEIVSALAGKQPLDPDLTAIAAATATTDSFLQAKASAWTSRTPTQVAADLVTPLSSSLQPLDGDLTTLAGLTPTNDDIVQRKAGAWTNRTMVQLKTDLALNNVDNTSNTIERAAVRTLTNARITKRVGSTASSATPTASADDHDIYKVTALATGATFGAPTGTPTDGQMILYRIKDNGTARALAWNAIFLPVGVNLPTTTVISKWLYVLSIYSTDDSKWHVLSAGQEA